MDWGMMQNPQALVTKTCITTSALVGVGTGGTTNHNGTTTTTNGGSTMGNGNDSIKVNTRHHGGDNDDDGNDDGHDDERSRSSKHRNVSLSHPSRMACHRIVLRPRLRFGVTMSVMIVLSDAVLRFSWLLRFVSQYLFVSHDAFVLCTQFLEVFRRAIWNLLRVEWEHIKQKSKALKARDSLSDTDDDNDDNDEDDNNDDEEYGAGSRGQPRLLLARPINKTSEHEMVSLLNPSLLMTSTTTGTTSKSTTKSSTNGLLAVGSGGTGNGGGIGGVGAGGHHHSNQITKGILS